MSYQILMVEQDATLAGVLRFSLMKKGNPVVWCKDYHEAVRCAAKQSFDLMIVDSELAGWNGLDLLVRLRHGGIRLPIILLHGSGQDEDVVRALALGAEVVLRKPFGCEELMARIHAVMRRIHGHVMRPVFSGSQDEAFRFGLLDVFPRRLEVCMHDKCVSFRRGEFRLIFHLLKHPGTVFSTVQLREVVFGEDAGQSRRIVHHVSAIRKKMQGIGSHAQIQTVPSVGYRLVMQQIFAARNISL